GTRIQELVLLCFHYRPITSKYGALIMTSVRLMAVATVAGLGWLIIGMALREPRKRPARMLALPERGCVGDQPQRVVSLQSVRDCCGSSSTQPRSGSDGAAAGEKKPLL